MKKRIIISSILITIVVLVGVLFGAVFCLRRQSVSIVGNEPIDVSAEEIIEAAQFKTGRSIFMLDKDAAINNIESTFPEVKVVQIKTISVVEVQIIIRARIQTYYTKCEDKFYALDEDLKVLKITTDIADVENLIFIENSINGNEEEKLFNITGATQVCSFIGGEYQDIFYNLYTSIYKTATKIQDGKKVYLTRQEVIDLIASVEILKGNTLTEQYNRIIVTTSTGVTFDIAKPNENLENKVNRCVSAYESGEFDITTGSIRIYLDKEGNEKFDYLNS